MPNVAVKDGLLEDGYGEFDPSVDRPKLDPQTPSPQVVFVHEVGHMLEVYAPKTDDVETWFRAFEKTKVYEPLMALCPGNIIEVDSIKGYLTADYQRYLASYTEIRSQKREPCR